MTIRRTITALLFLLLVAPYASAAEKAGDIIYARGAAALERAGKAVPAKAPMALRQGDRIVTKKGGLVKLLFRDDSVLTVGPDSILSVDQYLYDAKQKRSTSVFQLLLGKLRTVVGRTTLTVKTPTAVAGARGTVFFVWFDANTQTTGVSVLEGEVDVNSSDPKVGGVRRLGAGQTSTVRSGSPPGAPSLQPPPGGFDDNGLPEPEDSSEIGGIEGLTPYSTPPIEQQPNTTQITIDIVFP